MVDESYLIRGLDALCRAYRTDFFADGHRGAAIISAYYLCREHEVEPAGAETIREIIDHHWAHTPLCAPFPEEAPEPDRLADVSATMVRHLDGLRMVGHNVIFPALALKAFRQLPETVTPSRVAGLCRLVECFAVPDDLAVTEADGIPRLGTPPEVADLLLAELLRTMTAFSGRGQGWSGHLMTYGRALLDLRAAGHEDLAKAAEPGFRVYLKRIRQGPRPGDRAIPEHPETSLRPHQLAYWEQRRQASPGLGHVFKYPYGFYGLLNLAQDDDLKRQAMAAAYHIL